ncbi:MAG: PilT/PilU family type 4a pilus ATPase [Planctomycetes bacterium]|nr:PilT/PilU family type 4a pilus ATPase [Planctomycetota bacterium]
MRVDGKVLPLSNETLTQDFCIGLCEALTGKTYPGMFLNSRGLDLAIEVKGIGRFRANLFHQRGRLGGVFRHIQERIPTFEELNLPSKTLMNLTAHQRGLILVTGIAGSGKSTTIASMIEHINQSSSRHIITVEDPIEYVYTEKQSIIDQREVGLDTQDFMSALKSVVRQAPDVIFIGEMRDKETMEAAISAAETGHLVFSTLHTVNAQQTVERIITYFPPYQHDLIRMQLSLVLQGVLSQRLLPKKESKGRVPAVEIMLGTPTIRDLLLTGKTTELYAAIAQDVHWGNQTFNESIKQLYQSGIIGLEEALASADNPDELKLEIRGIVRGTRAADYDQG